MSAIVSRYAPIPWRVMVLALQKNLILRTARRALGAYECAFSKDGQQHDWLPPFETRRFATILRVRFVRIASS